MNACISPLSSSASSQRLLRCASSSNYNTTYNAFSPLRQQPTPSTSRGGFGCAGSQQSLVHSPLTKVDELNSKIGELTLEINVLKDKFKHFTQHKPLSKSTVIKDRAAPNRSKRANSQHNGCLFRNGNTAVDKQQQHVQYQQLQLQFRKEQEYIHIEKQYQQLQQLKLQYEQERQQQRKQLDIQKEEIDFAVQELKQQQRLHQQQQSQLQQDKIKLQQDKNSFYLSQENYRQSLHQQQELIKHQFESQITSLTDNVSSLQAQLLEATSLHSHTLAQINEYKALYEKEKQLNLQAQLVLKQNENCNEESALLHSKIEELTALMQAMINEKDELVRANEAFQGQIASIENERTSNKRMYAAEIAELTKQKEKMFQRVSSLEHANEQLTQTLLDKNALVNELQSRVLTVMSDISNKEKTILALNSKEEMYRTVTKEYEDFKKTAAEKETAFQQEIAKLKDKQRSVSELNAVEKDKSLSEIKSLRSNAQLQEQVKSALLKEINALKQTLKANQIVIDTQTSELVAKDETITELEHKLMETQIERENAVVTQCAKYKVDIDELTCNASELRKELEKEKEKYKEVLHAKEENDKRIALLQSELTAYHKMADEKEGVEMELKRIEGELETQRRQNELHVKEKTALNETLNALQQERNALLSQCELHQNEIATLTSTVNELRSKHAHDQTQQDKTDTYNEQVLMLQAQIEIVNDELSIKNEELNQLKERFVTKDIELSTNKATINDMELQMLDIKLNNEKHIEIIKQKEQQIQTLLARLEEEKSKQKITEDLLNKSKGCSINNTVSSLGAVTAEDNEKLKAYCKEKKHEVNLLKEQIVLLRNEIKEMRNMQQQVKDLPEFKSKVYSLLNSYKPQTQHEKQTVLDIKAELDRVSAYSQ